MVPLRSEVPSLPWSTSACVPETLCAANLLVSTLLGFVFWGTTKTSKSWSPESFEVQSRRTCESPGVAEGAEGAAGGARAKLTCNVAELTVGFPPSTAAVTRRTQKNSLNGEDARLVVFKHPPAKVSAGSSSSPTRMCSSKTPVCELCEGIESCWLGAGGSPGVVEQVLVSFTIQAWTVSTPGVGTTPRSYRKSMTWSGTQSDLPMFTDGVLPLVIVVAKLLVMVICCAKAAAGASSAATRASRATCVEIANRGPAVNRPLAPRRHRVAPLLGQSVRA